MKELFYDGIIQGNGIADAILHTHEPFIKDYLILHILLRKYNPKTVLEIGTHIGEGTQIICNAVPKAKVYSLDLPLEETEKTLQHPVFKGIEVGAMCTRTYTQMLCDSLDFDYSKYPCAAYFVDGEHTEKNVLHETVQILNCKPKLIIYHDYDISEVASGIKKAFSNHVESINYYLYLIKDTSIAYATRRMD